VDQLARLGFRTPRAWVCLAAACAKYAEDPRHVEAALRAELSALLALDRAYAVRSSANLEDGAVHSFAGQFASELDVCGLEAVFAAIRRVWASADNVRVRAYREKAGVATPLRMGVLIQEMVNPYASGVAFSRNPVTGLDEVVVEAVAGRGDALVQDGVTPVRWVYKWGGWLAQPPAGQAAIPLGVAQQVVDETRAIAEAWGAPVDLEWVYDGAALYWVQVRSITAGAGVALYSNRIAREVMPGQIKPLVWSVNVPLVNGAWVRLFTELIGPHTIDPSRLAKAFYYRAYFNMGEIGRVFEALGMPRDSLELLLGIDAPDGKRPRMQAGRRTLAHVPRLLRFGAAKWRFDRQVDRFVPQAWAEFRQFQRDDLDMLSAAQLLAEIDRLCALVGDAAYFNIVTPLLMQIHGKLYDMQVARAGLDARQYDVTRGLPALQAHDPSLHLAALHVLWTELPPEVRDTLLADGGQAPGDQGPDPQVQAFGERFDAFLHNFGHLSDSGNDFSVAPWREKPDLLLCMVANTVPAAGTAAAPPLPQPQRTLLAPLQKRLRNYCISRAEVSSVYTFGYGLLRNYFLALGRCYVAAGVLGEPEDIFYLYLEEVRACAAGTLAPAAAQQEVAARREEMAACRNVTLPSLIYGEAPPPISCADGSLLTGTPTSRGYYRGPACVVRGLHEFAKLQAGDVLIVPFSDVGWTPLFHKAGAVVAEAGGTLSHSSIIAREYGIPAVVSVPGACTLTDGVEVTVDGYTGRVLVHAADSIADSAGNRAMNDSSQEELRGAAV
jgi:pyruvate,water dikinase